MTMRKDEKIAIIGAGPAGLSAAEALKELGYQHITVFEKLDRVGGMSLSKYYTTSSGQKIAYELGSLQPTGSKKLSALLKKYDLHHGKHNASQNKQSLKIKMYSLNEHRAVVNFVDHLSGFPLSDTLRFFPQTLRFVNHLIKNYALIHPGYTHIGEKRLSELSIGYEDWLDQMNFKSFDLVLRMLGSMATFSNPIPRKNITLLANTKIFLNLLYPPMSYINGTLRFIKQGYQELWNRVAKNHEIIFNSNINKLIRKPTGVEIYLDDKVHTFDKAIITCSLAETLHFLDVTDDERELFNKVQYSPGWRVAFLAKKMPHDALYALIEPYLESTGETNGVQTFYPEGKVDEETWLYSSVFNENKYENIETALANAKELLSREFGATDIQWLDRAYWPEYVPYFLGEDIKNNILQKIEGLQGKNSTYFLGGTLSGSAQAVVIEYSYDRINKIFG